MKPNPILAFAAVTALGLGGWAVLAPAEETKPPVTLAPPEAEIEVPPPSGRDNMAAGKSLVERGAEMFLRGLLDEVGPQLDEMQKGLGEAAEQLGPQLKQFLALVDDLRNYAAPERLPNGDVIFRRLPGAPKPPPLMAPDAGAKKPEAPTTEL